MPRRNKTRYALLGILSRGPHSGYDIKQFSDEVLSHFWKESYGQIYPLLAQLEEEGLVRKQSQPGKGRPGRNVYSLTPQGKRSFLEWLGEPAELPPVRNEMLLKIFFGRPASPGLLIQQVNAFSDACHEMQQMIEQVEREMRDEMKDDPEYPYWQLTVHMGRLVAEARQAWCRAALKTLRRLAREERST